MKQGWEIKKVGDCFESIKNGANIKQERGATGIPITRIETLSGGVFNRDRLGYANILSSEKYISYVLDDGDLLLSHINSKTYIGRTVVYNKQGNEEIIHGMNLLRLKVIRKILSPYYAYYCFKSDLFRNQVASYRKDAVNQSSIPVTDLKKINMPIPPLSEQEKIVAELDCISGIIEKKKQQLKEYDSLTQSIFYEMFGNPIDNEKGWEVKTIDSLCFSIVRGPFGSALKKEYFIESTPTAYKVYEQKHAIQKNAEIGTYYISAERFATLSRFEVKGGDIIMSCSGTIGELFEIPIGAEKGLMNQALLKFTLNNSIEKIYFLFAMECVKDGFDKKGTGLQNVGSVGNIKKTRISLPPLSLQQEFASKIEAIEKQKELIKQSIAETETLFNSRMDFYFG